MGSWRTPASAAKSLGEVFHRLTDRDRAIIDVLGRCKLITVVQLSRIFFDSESAAYDRLKTLVELEILARRRPSTHGAYRYYLD